MYPSSKYKLTDIAPLIEVIKTYPLATLISVENNQPLITHLPLIYNDGKLTGHIDIYNPQAKLLGNDHLVTAIFSGPEGYISPKIFKNNHLPTWNYVRVHIIGRSKSINEKSILKKSLIEMTTFFEAPNNHYILKPDNPRMAGNLDYIQMFEITITSWEGKFKLSQDKKPSEQLAAKKQLIDNFGQGTEVFLNKIL